MHFLSLLTTALLATSTAAIPHEKRAYTAAQTSKIALGDKFYKAALAAVGIKSTPKLARSPVFGKTPAQKKLGDFGDAVLNQLTTGNAAQNVVFVRQHEASWADTT